MTTVVATRTHMAADTFFTDGSRGTKIRRVGRSLIGYCGPVYQAIEFIAWVEAGMRGAPPLKDKDKSDHVGFVLLNSSGLYQMEGRGTLMPVDAEYWAIGSGADYAVGAMAAGATVEEAIEIAARYDPATKLPFTVEKLRRR